jgi:hypothetical protein
MWYVIANDNERSAMRNEHTTNATNMPPSCRKGGMMAEPPPTLKDGPYSLYYGGITSTGAFDDGLWSLLMDEGWLPFDTKTTAAPRPRWKGAFCRVDEFTVVLFGGSDDRDYFDDTWILKVSLRLPTFRMHRAN